METRKNYSFVTLLDPRFKMAGFSKKDNAILARELIIGLVTSLKISIDYKQCPVSTSLCN